MNQKQDKARVLLQLDPDPQASSFDSIVAVDAGVDRLFRFSDVRIEQVESLVHGAIFTRSPDELSRTAIFVGGTDVSRGEALTNRVLKSFFGPMRVSVMLDANGANTTAAAAVLAAGRHVTLSGASVLVLAGTGPVGQRAARLLAREGASVRLASRSLKRATEAARAINQAIDSEAVTGVETSSDSTLAAAIAGADVVIAAGAAGVKLLPEKHWRDAEALKVAIDLNAVPPLGVEGVEVMDKAAERHGKLVYGAIGVGGTKMKIHKAAIAGLFEANDRVYDAEAIYDLGKSLMR